MSTGKTDVFETDVLGLMFQNVTIPTIGDATGVLGSSVAGSLYLSLHTASPVTAGVGSQNTNEVSYGGYARLAVARTSGEFSVSGGILSLVSLKTWPACTSGTATVTHIGIGTDLSGAGILLYSTANGNGNLDIRTGVIPTLAAGGTLLTEG